MKTAYMCKPMKNKQKRGLNKLNYFFYLLEI